jgi:hypothetical protein
LDKYEPDNNFESGRIINRNSTQLHSISQSVDQDYYSFNLDVTSEVTIETIGVNGNTQIELYDGSRQFLSDDDDSGVGENAKVVVTLAPGSYFFMVEEKGNDQTIPSYIISLETTSQEVETATVSVDPETGDQNTVFHFEATYTDENGDLPNGAELVVLGDPNSPYSLTRESGNQKAYYRDTKLPIGNQKYYARFVNNANELVQSDTEIVKVVNSDNMTIDVNIHCDEEGESLAIKYKKTGETKYTTISLAPEEQYSVSVEPGTSIEFVVKFKL